MCHRRLFNGEDFDRFSRTQKKPHRGRHMHGMRMETRSDTHVDAPTCVPVKLANLDKCGCAAHARTRTLYLSACFTTLLWLAGGLWPSAVLQRQPVMCQERENEEGGNRGRKRKRKRRRR